MIMGCFGESNESSVQYERTDVHTVVGFDCQSPRALSTVHNLQCNILHCTLYAQ